MRKRLETGTPGSRLAIVVATALVTTMVVAGGVALATVGINSVGSPEIKNGSIRSVDLRNNGVRSIDIQNGTVISPDIGNNSVKGVDIKDGTITSVDIRNGTITAADLRNGDTIRAASASSPEIDESIFVGGAADILTTTIRAPRPGLLVMGASVDASGATDDQYTCQVRVDGFIVAGSSRVSRVNWAGVNRTENSQENCATDAVQVVGAGLHTVAFHVFGRNTAAFHSGTVWAIWVPFDGNGNVPTP